jgi:acetyl-CoA carboxylase biotin carboxyl carrier protein
MAGPSSNQDVFDVRKIRRLVELMKEHELNEIDLRQNDMRIQLRRGGTPVVVSGGTCPAPAPPPPVTSAKAAPATQESEEEQIALIKSPIVGTFYAAPDPESSPYVKVGDHVGPETTVCVVEAMKVFNEIPAEVAGKIVAVLVENGDPVEYGQPLFKVDTQQ